jgi:glycine betaine/proline transport system ATP-binding protein
MLSCRHIWKIYGRTPERALHAHLMGVDSHGVLASHVTAVADVSFDVSRGETFVVMGLSGSGKSTLVRCIARLTEPTAGEVLLDGENVLRMSESNLRDVRRHKMAMVFQNFGLLPHRSVLDNVAFGLEVRGEERRQRVDRAMQMIDLVGLKGWERRLPRELSGGMQQRVGLARALAVDPELLLFDEPFSALDPLIRREMQDEVIRLRREVNKTMVFITHDLSEALRIGDRIAIMRDGRFVQVGTPAEVVLDPADDYVRNFVRDVPRSHVVPVEAVMRPAGDGPFAGDVAADTKVRDVVSMVATTDLPLRVLGPTGAVVGAVSRSEVLAVIAGSEV